MKKIINYLSIFAYTLLVLLCIGAIVDAYREHYPLISDLQNNVVELEKIEDTELE